MAALWLAVLSGLHPAPAQAQVSSPQAQAAGEDEDDEVDEVVVMGRPRRGSAPTDIAPEADFNSTAIRGLGVGSLGEVLEQFSAQSQGADPDEAPVILVNGRRASGLAAVEDLPPEAIHRIEIFPEAVALQYGYRPGQRVVNIILRKAYRALGVQGRYDLSPGDGDALRLKTNLVRIALETRSTLDLEYRREEAQYDDDFGATRAPATERMAVNGAFSRSLGAVAASANFRLQGDERQDVLAAAGLPGASEAVRRDRRRNEGLTALTLNGKAGDWTWSATADYDRTDEENRTSIGGSAAPSLFGVATFADTAREIGRIELAMSGAALELPNGDAKASFTANLVHRRLTDHGAGHGAVSQDGMEMRANVDVPLMDSAAGELTANLYGSIGRLDDYGSLTSAGYGLRWTPTDRINLSGSLTREDIAPDIEEAAGPILATPNTIVYDFAGARAVAATEFTGGNPDLSVEDRKVMALRVQARPVQELNLSLSADYTESRARNESSGPVGPTPDLEAAMPERFTRDQGRLVGFDARPFPLARHDQRRLRSGLNYTRALAAPPVSEGALTARAGQIQLALYHTWRIEDEVRLGPGSPPIDLLDGGALGRRGGVPKHEIELQSSVQRGAVGVRITGRWESDTSMADPARANARLIFSREPTVDLRLLIDLQRLPIFASTPWVRGRLNLSFENVFAARTRVADEAGHHLAGLARSDDQGRGRAVRLTVRKQFR